MTFLRRPRTWFAVFSLLLCWGDWLYLQRVLVAHQVRDAAAHDLPRGNLSDLYPRWLGARELLLHQSDPYSAEVTREIQTGYYGRPLDASRSSEPHDQVRFAYPVYVIFLLAPTVKLPFAAVQLGFYWFLLVATAGSTVLWSRILHWRMPIADHVNALALLFGSIAVMQGLKLQQMSLLVAALICVAVLLLQSGYMIAAGILLAVCTIKPQLVLLLLVWLALWLLGDVRGRYRLGVSFLITMALLFAASEWLLPRWLARFWDALVAYRTYAPSASVLDSLVGAPWSWALEAVALASILLICWRERRQRADTQGFAFITAMVLAATVLLIPTSAQYNQVLLVPAILFLAKGREALWRKGTVHRVLLTTTSLLLGWSWISAALLGFWALLASPQSLDRFWSSPVWTTPQVPIAVTALMLIASRDPIVAFPPNGASS